MFLSVIVENELKTITILLFNYLTKSLRLSLVCAYSGSFLRNGDVVKFAGIIILAITRSYDWRTFFEFGNSV